MRSCSFLKNINLYTRTIRISPRVQTLKSARCNVYISFHQTLITSEVSGQLWNACAWDLHSGTSLVTYKGAAAGQRSLCTINNNLVISANANKPHIQLWSIHKVTPSLPMLLPSLYTALSFKYIRFRYVVHLSVLNITFIYCFLYIIVTL